MPEIPSSPPTEIRAGDTAQWRRSLSDYPAGAGWALDYTIVSPSAVHSFAGVADVNAHAVTVPAADTATWEPGTYRVHETVTSGVMRFTTYTGSLRVLPNLAAVGEGGLDTRSHARKVLDALEAWIEAKSPTAASFELAGRKLQNYPLEQLLAFRDRYRAEVNREARAEQGLGSPRILVRF